MSFSVSIGDVVLLSRLALDVYRKLRSASNEYSDLATKASLIAIILQELNRLCERTRLTESHRNLLQRFLGPCEDTLRRVDEQLVRNQDLDPHAVTTGHIFARFRWVNAGGSIEEACRRLQDHLHNLQICLQILTLWQSAEPREYHPSLSANLSYNGSQVISATGTSSQSSEEHEHEEWPQQEREVDSRGNGREQDVDDYSGPEASSIADSDVSMSSRDSSWSSLTNPTEDGSSISELFPPASPSSTVSSATTLALVDTAPQTFGQRLSRIGSDSGNLAAGMGVGYGNLVPGPISMPRRTSAPTGVIEKNDRTPTWRIVSGMKRCVQRLGESSPALAAGF